MRHGSCLLALAVFLCFFLNAPIPAIADDIDADGWDDGVAFTDQNSDGYDDSHVFPPPREEANDILIVSSTNPRAFFGFYRATQMTDPGWTFLRRTIDWADGQLPPEQTELLLFTYNNDLQWPVDYLQEDGFAVYTYLVGQGFNITGHHQWDMPDLDIAYYQTFDVIVYWNIYCYDPSNAIASGVPLISCCAGHAQLMNLGGAQTLHQSRQDFCIENNSYYPTEPYDLGEISFVDAMWVDGVIASGEGVPLVTDICEPTPIEQTTWGRVKGLYR
jgi:hypothetical protein